MVYYCYTNISFFTSDGIRFPFKGCLGRRYPLYFTWTWHFQEMRSGDGRKSRSESAVTCALWKWWIYRDLKHVEMALITMVEDKNNLLINPINVFHTCSIMFITHFCMFSWEIGYPPVSSNMVLEHHGFLWRLMTPELSLTYNFVRYSQVATCKARPKGQEEVWWWLVLNSNRATQGSSDGWRVGELGEGVPRPGQREQKTMENHHFCMGKLWKPPFLYGKTMEKHLF